MDLAVIKTGGKQYIVMPGKKIKIEKIEQKTGSEINFREVLLSKRGEKVEVGNPLVREVKVIGKVLKHGKGEKITILKYKPKTRYRVKRGHRQLFTEVEIKKIEIKK